MLLLGSRRGIHVAVDDGISLDMDGRRSLSIMSFLTCDLAIFYLLEHSQMILKVRHSTDSRVMETSFCTAVDLPHPKCRIRWKERLNTRMMACHAKNLPCEMPSNCG